MAELYFRKSSSDITLLTEVLMGTEWQYWVVGHCSKCVECNYFGLLMKSRAWPFIVLWSGRKPAFLRKEEGTRSWDPELPHFYSENASWEKLVQNVHIKAVWSLLYVTNEKAPSIWAP